MTRFSLQAATFVGALVCSAFAQAVPVTFQITGTVSTVATGNVYGLAVGETISAIAHFDDSLIAPSGGSTVELGTTGNAFGALLSFFVGAQQFSANNDADYLGNVFPIIDFWDGLFDGFDFKAEAGSNGALASFVADLFSFSGADGLSGSFDLQSVSITPYHVPEPATFALGILALVATWALRRRSQSALRAIESNRV